MTLEALVGPARTVEEAWAEAGPAALIDHIVRRYHDVHRDAFPEAIAMARRVEATHGDHPRCPRGLADHLAVMADHLLSHQHREEAVLFPLMLSRDPPTVRIPVARMAEEHRDIDEQMLRIAVLTTDFSPPDDACATWRALYRACHGLARDLREHVRLENEILFPSFLEPG